MTVAEAIQRCKSNEARVRAWSKQATTDREELTNMGYTLKTLCAALTEATGGTWAEKNPNPGPHDLADGVIIGPDGEVVGADVRDYAQNYTLRLYCKVPTPRFPDLGITVPASGGLSGLADELMRFWHVWQEAAREDREAVMVQTVPLLDMAQGIAAAMGPGWVGGVRDLSQPWDRLLLQPYMSKGDMEVRAVSGYHDNYLPRYEWYGVMPDKHSSRGPHITTAKDRSPKQVGRDIARRLLPEYEVAYANALEALDERAATIARRAKLVARLHRALLPIESSVTPLHEEDTGQPVELVVGYDRHGACVTVRAYDEDGAADLKFRSLPVSVAEAMLKAYTREMRKLDDAT